MSPMEEYLQFLSLHGAQPDTAAYTQGKKLAESLGGTTPAYTGAKNYAPFEQFLKQQFGNIRDPNASPMTREEFNTRASNAENTGAVYDPNRLQVAPHLQYNPSISFGGVADRNNPIGISSLTPTGYEQTTTPNEYGGMEPTAGAPTGYSAALTTPYYRDGVRGQYSAQYDDKGQIIGNPEWVDVPNQETSFDRILEDYGLLLPLALVAPYAIPEMLAAAGVGAGTTAGGVTAASLGELGLNTALAAGTPGGIASGLSAASLGELGINTALAAGSEGGIAAGTALSGVEAAPSFLDSINLGKTFFPDAPGYVQQGVNRFGTGLVTSGGDPEAAARNALMGGVTDFINPYFSELPKEFQPIAKAGVQSALQGGSAEDIFKGAAGAAILNPISSAVSEVAGPAAAKAATAVTRQLLSSGSIDPSKITVNMLGDFIGSAVSKETNRFLGDAAAAAIRNRGDLEAAFKQLAMGALNTPAKKGG